METAYQDINGVKSREKTANNGPEISIIVGVYKVEKYLRKCLSSIMNQTYKDWECIVVDDGSPDGSPAICDEYATLDQRFRVIHQQNSGLSAVRNVGLREANGRYVGFIDSDDWVEPDMYEHLHQLIREYDADMVQIGYYKEIYGYSHHKRRVHSLRVLDRKEAAKEMVLAHSIPSYLCMKLIKRSVMTSEFPEGQIYEDVSVLSNWMANVHKVVLSPKMLYHYLYRKGSIVRTKSPKDRAHFFQCYYIDRIHVLEQHEPNFLTPEERHKALWGGYMGKAKATARIKELSRDDKHAALLGILAEATKDAGAPDSRILGRKLFKRISTLQQQPDRFIRKSLITQRINEVSAKFLPF